MRLLAPLRLRVETDIVTRVHRSLKGRGRLNVQAGQEVAPDHIIGSSEVSSGFRTVNLATLLSVSPKEVKNFLKREVGQKIYKGELLAFKAKGFFHPQRIVTAPTDGLIDFLNPQTGEIRITFLPKKVDLPAAVYGVVEAVDQNRGVVIIRTQVSKIYGMFGTGKARDGILTMVSKRDELVTASKIPQNLGEEILVGGGLIYKETISEAISLGINGIITGGINAKDYKGMAGGRLIFPKKLDNDIGISIIVCEGFGSIPIGEDIHEMLLNYNGRFVLIDGNLAVVNLPSFESSCMNAIRKTKLPSLAPLVREYNERQIGEVKLNQKARVVGSSFAGEQGKIIAIDASDTLLPSGIRTYLVTLETKRRKIKVPSTNIEITI